MIARLACMATFMAAVSSATIAQGSAGKAGEVVIAANGAPVAPWIEHRVCDENDKCSLMIVNKATREVARLDGRLTSMFKATGSGKEVVRAYDKLF